jgi:phosphate/sulfate permease
MTDPILKIQILARAEMSLLRVQASRNINRIIMLLVALVFALLALGMFNFAAYQALAESRSPAVAAMLVALADCMLAIGVIVIASKSGSDSEQEKVIRDIRDLAYNELSTDFDEVKEKFSEVSDDVHRIRTGFSALSKGSSNMASSIGPLISILVGALKKSR